MKKISLLWGIALTLLLSFSSLHAEDFWQDTLWMRKMPFGEKTYAKVMFHPDGKSVFAAADQYLFEYDVQTGNLLKTRQTKSGHSIGDYLMTSDQQFFIIGTVYTPFIECNVEVWHKDTGFVKSLTFECNGYTKSIALSPDDKKLYLALAPYPSIYKIDLESMAIDVYMPNVGQEIALSPDGKTLISTVDYPEDRSFFLSPESLQPISVLPTPIHNPKFSKNGTYIGGSTRKFDKVYTDYVVIFNNENKEVSLMEGHKREIADVCFSANEKYIISIAYSEEGSPKKGGYRVWDIETKQQIFEAPYYTGGHSIMISQDNKLYAKVTTVRQIQMWNFRTSDISSIGSDSGNNIFTISPNPSQAFIELRFPSIEVSGTIIITDIKGKIFLQRNIDEKESVSGNLLLNISSLYNGKYVCTLHFPSKIYTSSFIINR